MTPAPNPSPLAGYLTASITTVVGLAVTQSLITDRTAQFVTGLAAVLVPAVLALANALVHAAHVRAHATVPTFAPFAPPPTPPPPAPPPGPPVPPVV